MVNFCNKSEVEVGIVGTGYAAKKRAEAIIADNRSKLIAFSGNTPEKIAEFEQSYRAQALDSWVKLIDRAEIDLIIVSSINRDRAEIVRAALQARKNVIAEYPLALNSQQARELIALAEIKNKLLHVEHIELLGGLHRAIRKYLPEIGKVFSARYTTISPKRPAPRNWTYNHQLFGFPLSAALSRIHRFTDLFGEVKSVTCQARFWDAPESGYYTSCLCEAQLLFSNGLIGNITYGKGEVFVRGYRDFEISGEQGKLIFQGDKGMLIQAESQRSIELETRRGLFAKDTQMVLDCLLKGDPLYVSPDASAYALKVGEAAELSAKTGQTVLV